MSHISPSRKIFGVKPYSENAVIRFQEVIAEFEKFGWKVSSQDQGETYLNGIAINNWIMLTIILSFLGFLGFPIVVLIILYLFKELEIEVRLANDNQVRILGDLGTFSVSNSYRGPRMYVTSKKVLILQHGIVSGLLTLVVLLSFLSG